MKLGIAICALLIVSGVAEAERPKVARSRRMQQTYSQIPNLGSYTGLNAAALLDVGQNRPLTSMQLQAPSNYPTTFALSTSMSTLPTVSTNSIGYAPAVTTIPSALYPQVNSDTLNSNYQDLGDNSKWEALRDSYIVEPSAPGNFQAVVTKKMSDTGTWLSHFTHGRYVQSFAGFLGQVPPSGYNADGTPIIPCLPGMSSSQCAAFQAQIDALIAQCPPNVNIYQCFQGAGVNTTAFTGGGTGPIPGKIDPSQIPGYSGGR